MFPSERRHESSRAAAAPLLLAIWLRCAVSVQVQVAAPPRPRSARTVGDHLLHPFPEIRQCHNATVPPWDRRPSAEEEEAFFAARQRCQPRGAQPLEDAVVVYLVTRSSDVRNLVENALPRLWHFFLRSRPYPVVVFVPSAELRAYDPKSFGQSLSREGLQRELRERSGLPGEANVTVAEYSLEFPASIASDPDWKAKQTYCAAKARSSYKHMNQFFTKTMYEHPALAGFRYYARFDADIFLTAEVPTDPLCLARTLNRTFMWQARHAVHDMLCVNGMAEWFEDYAGAQGLEPRDPSTFGCIGGRTAYQGFIGVGDLGFFRSPGVRRLAKAFNEDGRVYRNRWTDQTYYVLALALFGDPAAVGNIGISWPGDTWCHKCGMPAFKDAPSDRRLPRQQPGASGPLHRPS